MRTAADLAEPVRQLVIDGRQAWHDRDYERARSLFEEVLRVSLETSNSFGELAAYHFLGNIAFNECRDDESRALHGLALKIARRENDQQGIGTSLGGIAFVDIAQGKSDAARRGFEAAAVAFEAANMHDRAEGVREKADDLLSQRVPLNVLVHRTQPR